MEKQRELFPLYLKEEIVKGFCKKELEISINEKKNLFRETMIF